MLIQADTPIEEAIRFFAGFGRFASYFVPTETGLRKSIIDATGSMRDFFKSEKIHDYDLQATGPLGKVKFPLMVVTTQGLFETQMSIYRPQTKEGDPRFWILEARSSGWSLPRFAKSGNLLAFFIVEGKLYLLNMSDIEFLKDAYRVGSPLASILSEARDYLDPIAQELLEKMRELRSRGFIQSLRPGDTGIGFTLETLLGIPANSSKTPDYKGIELKSGRVRETRANLFSKTPDWKKSPYSTRDIVERYGYVDADGVRACRNTLNHKPNSQGLYLFVPMDEQFLEGRARVKDFEELLTIWPISALKNSLRVKHQRTFWVKAKSQLNMDGFEEFRYDTITYTKEPLIENFAPLVSTGHITCDFTMHELPSGRIRDHGFLFKMKKTDLKLLFPVGREFSLAI